MLITPRLALSRTPEPCEFGAMIGYARALTENGLSLQRDKLLAAGCERLFEDRRGGNTLVRPALEEALASMTAGDALCVCRLDRLVWDTRDLLAFALSLSERGLHLVALAQELDTRRDQGAFYGFAAMLEDHHRGINADRLAEQRRSQAKRPVRSVGPVSLVSTAGLPTIADES